jgi:hypothetical protein
MAGCPFLPCLNQFATVAAVFARRWHLLLERIPDLVMGIEAVGCAEPCGK